MTREEAKQIFLNRGFVEVDGGSIFDGDKWRESCRVVSEWLEQEPCEDAISRAEAIDAMTHWFSDMLETGKEKYSIDDVLNSLSPVTPTQKWIPCSERLPENDEYVLGTNSSNDLFKTYTWDDCGEIKWYANGCFDVPVIAWLPLPEPYKAEMEGEE